MDVLTLSMKSQVMPIFLTFLLRLDKSGEGFLARFLCFDFAGATVEFAEGMNGVAGDNMDAETGSVVVFSSRDTCVLEAEIFIVGSSLKNRSTCVPVVEVASIISSVMAVSVHELTPSVTD